MVVVTWINTSDATKGICATAWDVARTRLPIYEYKTDTNEEHESVVTGLHVRLQREAGERA